MDMKLIHVCCNNVTQFSPVRNIVLDTKLVHKCYKNVCARTYVTVTRLVVSSLVTVVDTKLVHVCCNDSVVQFSHVRNKHTELVEIFIYSQYFY